MDLFQVSRNTVNAGVLFSASAATLLFAFILLVILSYAGRRCAAAGHEVAHVSSPTTSTTIRSDQDRVEVRMEGLRRHYGTVVALDGLDLTVSQAS